MSPVDRLAGVLDLYTKAVQVVSEPAAGHRVQLGSNRVEKGPGFTLGTSSHNAT